MRVLDTYTGQFVDIDPRSRNERYAILSHTWDREGEQAYQKLRQIQRRYAPSDDDSLSNTPVPLPVPTSGLLLSPIWADSNLSPKIREACRVARENGYRYLWIDSCCIDKTSSSELSESINSMYQWYARARVCYAFLPDVPAEEDHEGEDSEFRRSRWFGRGWTLQELISPVDVVFLSMEWKFIGSKESLADLVVEITNIAYNALLHVEPLDEFSVAQRLSWASRRQTTRVEDRAYSLLGLFDINMPTLYGEGARAFRRLQEEIMRRTPDQSLFVWGCRVPDPSFQFYDLDTIYANKESLLVYCDRTYYAKSLLAPSLDEFSECAGIEALSHDEVARRLQLPTNDLPLTDYAFTPYGIRVQLPVISFSSSDYFPPECVDKQKMTIPFSQWYLVILGCGHEDFPGHLLGRICYLQSSGSSIKSFYSGSIRICTAYTKHWSGLLPLSPATIRRLHSASQISMTTLYIPQPQRNKGANDMDITRQKPHDRTIQLVLSKKTRGALSGQGYTATLCGLDCAIPATHLLTLAHDTHTITIDYQHTLDKTHWSGQELFITAHVETSGPVLEDAWGDLPVPHVDHFGVPVVSWYSYMPWAERLGNRDVQLNIPGPMRLTLRLGLTFATKNHYFLDIELVTADESQHRAPGTAT